MIRVISGKRYNTDTATEVASYWNGLGRSDFRNLSETLYITAKGAWFLYGEGGAMTIYAESEGNQQWGSSRIIPFTEKEAFEWCEQHNEVDVIEDYFSYMVEEA